MVLTLVMQLREVLLLSHSRSLLAARSLRNSIVFGCIVSSAYDVAPASLAFGFLMMNWIPGGSFAPGLCSPLSLVFPRTATTVSSFGMPLLPFFRGLTSSSLLTTSLSDSEAGDDALLLAASSSYPDSFSVSSFSSLLESCSKYALFAELALARFDCRVGVVFAGAGRFEEFRGAEATDCLVDFLAIVSKMLSRVPQCARVVL